VFPLKYLTVLKKCIVLDDDCLNVWRHRRIVCCIKLPVVNAYNSDSMLESINWRKCNDAYIDDLIDYYCMTVICQL